MLRGFYTAASGMMAQQRYTESVSNNIANVNTPGYKADQAVLRTFPELLIQQMGQKNIPTNDGLQLTTKQPIGTLATGVYTQENIADFSQGPIRETGMDTDLAIVNGENLPDENGGIFFTTENDAGEERYTRNGHFTVDGEGFLTANNGYYVLDDNDNRIQVDDMQFTVTENGTIQIGNTESPLNMAYIADVNNLVKEENDLYQLETGNPENASTIGVEYQVLQETLEGSNVDGVTAMTDMMSAYRSFEMNQKVLKAYDQNMGRAVSEIARLR